jgi:hypothetical protein
MGLGFARHENKDIYVHDTPSGRMVVSFVKNVARVLEREPTELEKQVGACYMIKSDGTITDDPKEFSEPLRTYYLDYLGDKSPAKESTPASSASPAKEAHPAPAATTQIVPAQAKTPAAKKDFVAGQLGDIPQQFVMEMQGKPYVMKAGLLFMAKKMGVKGIQVEAVHYSFQKASDDPLSGVAVCKATVTLQDGSVYSDIGIASKENTNSKIAAGNLDHMASTRASNRALRLATACGMCSIEELPDAPADVIDAEGYAVDR